MNGTNNISLKKLISSGEKENLEFNEQPNDAFFKTISAFANTQGGEIILGVSNQGKIVGIEPSSEFLSSLTNRIVDKLLVYPQIETIDIEGKRIVRVRIARAGYPVSYEGRYYERVGNTTREISREKLEALMISRKTWDAIAGNFAMDEIDTETIKKFISLSIDSKRLTEISLKNPAEIFLQKLGFFIDGKLTNGAMLLFRKDPQKHFINLCVRIGRFKDEITIIDDKWVKGNLFEQFEETIKIIRQHISVRYEIKGFQREDIWDYPLEAIREAVLNALVHRDYFNVANFILIKIYDDHIWFHNPGGLPEGISIDQLKKPHSSVFRNPLIAKIFYLAGFTEQYGSGTVRMLNWMKSAGLPEPEYKEEMGGFSVYFYKDIYTEENLRKMGLNERQIKAVIYVKEKGKITNKEYQNEFSVSRQTATRDLIELVGKRIFELKGTGKRDTHYILVEAKMRQKMVK